MIFKKNKKKTTEQTPVEWLVGYLKEFNCIEDTLSTRKAIEKALKMEGNKFRLHAVISSVCNHPCCIELGVFDLPLGSEWYCKEHYKQTDL